MFPAVFKPQHDHNEANWIRKEYVQLKGNRFYDGGVYKF